MARKATKPRPSPMSRALPPGAVPGTVVSPPESHPTAIRVIAYGPDSLEEVAITNVAQIAPLRERFPVVWVNIEGLATGEAFLALGREFGLHPLALEDVVNLHQRPKVDQYNDHIYVVAQAPQVSERFVTEQISIFIGPNFVITIEEDPTPGSSLDPLRARVCKSLGRVRALGPSYLAYCVLDCIIDAYFPLMEDLGEKLEAIEEEIIDRPNQTIISRLHATKRYLLGMRRVVWPFNEAVNALMRDTTKIIHDDTRIYLRDLHDHLTRIMEMGELYRETCSDLMDIYLSSVSNRTNEVMKVLTVIATIFIPITFITSLYGMNFENMPELHWKYGYEATLLVMAGIGVGMTTYFQRIGWLGAFNLAWRRRGGQQDANAVDRADANEPKGEK